MSNSSLLTKSIKVLSSCKTTKQLEVAWRFAELASRKYENNDIDNKVDFLSRLSRVYSKKREKILKEDWNE